MRILVHCSDSAGDESDSEASDKDSSDSDSDSETESDTTDEKTQKLTKLILFVRDEIRKRAHYHIDQEYTAPRFEPEVKTRILTKPTWDSSPVLTGEQHFSVNCPVWLARVAFCGPAPSVLTPSYSVLVLPMTPVLAGAGAA